MSSNNPETRSDEIAAVSSEVWVHRNVCRFRF